MSDSLLKNEPANARFVIYSPSRGVYMGENESGEPRWSRDSGTILTSRSKFPTFPRADGQQKISVFWNTGGINDFKIMQVYPSSGDEATQADLNNAAVVP